MRDLQRSPRGVRRWGIAAVLLALFVVFASAAPALAAGAIQDDGNMFSAGARSSAEAKSNQIQRDTGKAVTVKTVANLGGKDISTTADQFFQQQKLNGVLIYAAKDDKKLAVKVGTDTRQAISTGEEGAIRDQLTQRFAANDFDGGLLSAIDRIGTDLRAAAPARTGQTQPVAATKKSGSGFPVFLVVLIVVAVIGVGIFLLMRRNRGSGTPSGPVGGYGPNYGPQGGYGPGYGPGYGQPGGGGNVAGSIIGGAAAGIGGAIVGNAIYDHFRDRDDDNRGQDGGDPASAGDYGAYGDDQGSVSDSGQDVGSWGGGDSSTGDWGSSDSGSDDFGGGDPGGD
jgi:uncharacterized membrane protein YgcG